MTSLVQDLVDEPVSAHFVPDPRLDDGVTDPVFGQVRRGRMNGLWAIENPALGYAQLTGGARVVTSVGDGSVCNTRVWFRRSARRHVDLGGHRYTLSQTWFRRARLLRDGSPVGWIRRTRTYEVIRWADPADRASILVGHLLASC